MMHHHHSVYKCQSKANYKKKEIYEPFWKAQIAAFCGLDPECVSQKHYWTTTIDKSYSDYQFLSVVLIPVVQSCFWKMHKSLSWDMG